jgi:RNA polymerase sigma-70 factor (ECF subfamily)
LRPWLLKILHNVIVDDARRSSRKKRRGKFEDSTAMLRLADHAPTPPQVQQRNEERDRAVQVLRNLPEEYRQVLSLRYLAGADYDAIAQQLALTNGSLRGLLSRGLAMMKNRMNANDRQHEST